MTQEPQPHRETFLVRSYEVDPQWRLSIRALCAYLQEAAGRHIALMGAGRQQLGEQGLGWVLHRLRLAVDAAPRLGDALEVVTWPRRFEGAVATREFEVLDGGGRRVAAATSHWVVVDLRARRAVRLPDLVRSLPVPARPPALDMQAKDLPSVGKPDVERRFDVRRSDLDALRHVNNTQYVAWILETVPDEILETHRPVGMEIIFKQESVYGDTVVSRSELRAGSGPTTFAHALRTEPGREVVQAVSAWEPA